MSEKMFGVWITGPSYWRPQWMTETQGNHAADWVGSPVNAEARANQWMADYGRQGFCYEVREYQRPEPDANPLLARLEGCLAPRKRSAERERLWWAGIRATALKHGAPTDSADAIADEAVRLVLEQVSPQAASAAPPPADPAGLLIPRRGRGRRGFCSPAARSAKTGKMASR